MRLFSITLTRNVRGQYVVKIFDIFGSIYDEAAFASAEDALEWVHDHTHALEYVP